MLETLSKKKRANLDDPFPQAALLHPNPAKSLDGRAHDPATENACVPLTGWWGSSLPAQ